MQPINAFNQTQIDQFIQQDRVLKKYVKSLAKFGESEKQKMIDCANLLLKHIHKHKEEAKVKKGHLVLKIRPLDLDHEIYSHMTNWTSHKEVAKLDLKERQLLCKTIYHLFKQHLHVTVKDPWVMEKIQSKDDLKFRSRYVQTNHYLETEQGLFAIFQNQSYYEKKTQYCAGRWTWTDQSKFKISWKPDNSLI